MSVAVPLAADAVQKGSVISAHYANTKKKKKVGWGGASEGEGRGREGRGATVACASPCSRSRAVPVTFHNFSQTDAETKGTTCAADVQCAAAGQL